MQEKDNSNNDYCYDRKLEITLKSIEDMNKYNSVVCSIGYISLLAVLSYAHKFIYNNFLIFICIFYLFSVAIFVIFEMRKVFLNNLYHSKVMTNLDEYESKKIDKKTLIEKNLKTKTECYKKFAEKQNMYFIPSALFGFLAGFFIILNFSLLLFEKLVKHFCCC